MNFDGNVDIIADDLGLHIRSRNVGDVEAAIKSYGGIVHLKISKPIEKGTDNQNRAAHSLLDAFYKTGMHSAPEWVTNSDLFKLWMKVEHGPCYQKEMKDGTIIKIPISWSLYSKMQRTDFIECIIKDITQSGALTESEKIQEIIKGMEENTLY